MDVKVAGFPILGAINRISKRYDPAGAWSSAEPAERCAGHLVSTRLA